MVGSRCADSRWAVEDPVTEERKMRAISLNDILEAAAREVSSWPEWMQRPEYRQRPPVANSHSTQTPPSLARQPDDGKVHILAGTSLGKTYCGIQRWRKELEIGAELFPKVMYSPADKTG